MWARRKRTMAWVMRSAALIALMVGNTPVAASGAILRLLPSPAITDGASGQATVNVQVQDPTDIAIYSLGIRYDPAIIDATVLPGADLDGCAFGANDTVAGKICLLITCHPALQTPNAVIATLSLKGNATAVSGLQFDSSGCEDPELAPGGCWLADDYGTPLSCGAFGGSVEVIPTATPTPSMTATPTVTPTATVTPTLAPPLSLNPVPATPAVALSGGIACVGLKLDGEIAGATGVESTFDLGGAESLVFGACKIHPGVGTTSAYGKELFQTSIGDGVEEITVAGSSVELPRGIVFACPITVQPGTANGLYPIGSSVEAFDAQNAPIANAMAGTVAVRVGSCVGDCNGDGEVRLGEVQRCLSHFLGQDLCAPETVESACPAADSNHDGRVSIGEVTQCVNRFIGSC